MFRIGGDDENALTGALVQSMIRSTSLLRAVLQSIGLRYLRADDLQSAIIHYQRHGEDRRQGITDIEIEIQGKLHVIIEAKIRGGVPGLRQCLKYLPRFSCDVRTRRLAVLVDAGDTGILEEYQSRNSSLKGVLVPMLWANIQGAAHKILRKASGLEQHLLSELVDFIEGDYYMKSFEEEVWVVPKGTEPLWDGGLSFLDIPIKRRIYFHPSTTSRRKAIYFAPRAYGRVESVQRIMNIEYDKRPSQYIPELSKFSWESEPHTIYHLGEPVKLPIPIRSGNIRSGLETSAIAIRTVISTC